MKNKNNTQIKELVLDLGYEAAMIHADDLLNDRLGRLSY